jgi:hypothetical protein
VSRFVGVGARVLLVPGPRWLVVIFASGVAAPDCQWKIAS